MYATSPPARTWYGIHSSSFMNAKMANNLREWSKQHCGYCNILNTVHREKQKREDKFQRRI